MQHCLVSGNTLDHPQHAFSAIFDSSVINSTVINNETHHDGPSNPAAGVQRGTVVNSIIWANCRVFPQDCGEEAQVLEAQVSHSLVQEWTRGGTGNSSADPLFADAWGRLMPTSPAIDAGDNLAVPEGVLTDLDGQPRFHEDTGMPTRGISGGAGGNNVVDLGAFEFQGTTCYANCDNSTAEPILNVEDFTCFINRFAAGDPYANCDGSTTEPILNVEDFTCFINAFVQGCP